MLFSRHVDQFAIKELVTVMPTKSDSDVTLCSQYQGKKITCTLHLIYHESIDHLCINPILRIGLMHK